MVIPWATMSNNFPMLLSTFSPSLAKIENSRYSSELWRVFPLFSTFHSADQFPAICLSFCVGNPSCPHIILPESSTIWLLQMRTHIEFVHLWLFSPRLMFFLLLLENYKSLLLWNIPPHVFVFSHKSQAYILFIYSFSNHSPLRFLLHSCLVHYHSIYWGFFKNFMIFSLFL